MRGKGTSFSEKAMLDCRGKMLDLSSPAVMGILNITPDSFYDGGKYKSEDDLLMQTEKMLDEGADIIDIGGGKGATVMFEKRIDPLAVESLVVLEPFTDFDLDEIGVVIGNPLVAVAPVKIIGDGPLGSFDSLFLRGCPREASRETKYP